jgi:surface antigen
MPHVEHRKIFAGLIAALWAGSASASGYLTADQIKLLINDRTIIAQTARDREPWRAFFSSAGTVRYVYSNSSTASGVWSIRSDRLLITLSGGPQCRKIYIDDANAIHWNNCDDNATTSYIRSVTAGNTLTQPATGLLGAKGNAAVLSIVRQFLGGLTQQIPPDVPVKPFFNSVMAGLIDPEIAKHLNDDDKQLAIQAILHGLQSGQHQDWSNPDSGRKGSYEPLGTYTDATGRLCQEYETPVTLEDGTKQTARRKVCEDPVDKQWEPVD